MTRGFKKVPNAEDIYNLLMSQDFDDWYRGDFEDCVVGEMEGKHKPDILFDIAKMFKVDLEDEKR